MTTAMKRTIGTLALFLPIVALAGCGNDTGSTEPAFDVRGLYSGTIRYTQTDIGSGSSETHDCMGSVDVTAHSGTTISGTVTEQASGDFCGSDPTPFSGTIQSDGTNLDVKVTGFPEDVGCPVSSGDGRFRGSISGNTLSASTITDFNCPALDLRIEISVSAIRP